MSTLHAINVIPLDSEAEKPIFLLFCFRISLNYIDRINGWQGTVNERTSRVKENVFSYFPQECSKRANNGRFSLRDLLMVPMQRVLKYHLLLQVRFCITPPEVSHFSMVWTVVLGLQELVKHTTDASDKENLRKALDAMKVCLHVFIYQWLCCFSGVMRCVFVCVQDLAQCVNEVKRDNEIIKQITTFQMSIENLVRALWLLCPCQVSSLYSSQLFSALQTQSLALYGRPKIDGELKISSSEKKSKQDRCRACVSQ